MAQINYNHLRYFWAVAHDGNLTRTADRLNLSQSALSVQIRKLEERLGHALFERRGRALHLTEAGRIALDTADAIFAAGDDLLATLNQTGIGRKALRVGALSTLSRNFQLALLRPMLRRSDVEVVLRSGTSIELLQALEGMNLDLVLTNQPPQQDAVTGWRVYRLSGQAVSLVGTAQRLGEGGTLATLLAQHPIILPTLGNSLRTEFDGLLNRHGILPQIAAEVDDMAMIRLLAREDVGLAVVPPVVVQDELTNGRLMDAGLSLGIEEGFYAVTTERRFPNPLVTELLDTAPNL